MTYMFILKCALKLVLKKYPVHIDVNAVTRTEQKIMFSHNKVTGCFIYDVVCIRKLLLTISLL